VQTDDNGNPIVVSIPVTATANGPITSKVVAPAAASDIGAAARLTGEATLSVTGGFVSGSTGEPVVTSVLSLAVSGFKQSSNAPSGGGIIGGG
jgi:hypothetical protein